jgi:hypothetical protein
MDGSKDEAEILTLRYRRVAWVYSFLMDSFSSIGQVESSTIRSSSCRAVWRHPADFYWIGRGSRCEWPCTELELDRRDTGAGAGKDLPADCGFSAHPQRDLTRQFRRHENAST